MAKCIKVNSDETILRLSDEEAFQQVEVEKTAHYVPKNVWKRWRKDQEK